MMAEIRKLKITNTILNQSLLIDNCINKYPIIGWCLHKTGKKLIRKIVFQLDNGIIQWFPFVHRTITEPRMVQVTQHGEREKQWFVRMINHKGIGFNYENNFKTEKGAINFAKDIYHLTRKTYSAGQFYL